MRIARLLFLLGAAWASPPVNIWLATPWNVSSPILETLEFLAQEGVDLHKVVADLPTKPTVADCFSLAESHLPDHLWNLHSYALQHRTMAPIVKAHYQLFATLNLDCPVVFEWNGVHVCNLDKLDFSVKNPKSARKLSLDHVLHKNNYARLVVYADLLSKEFKTLHPKLISLAQNGEFTYVLRHRPSSISEPISLSGYGVELWIKKTDYKVMDDRRIQFQDKQEQLAVDEEGETLEDLFVGQTPSIVPLDSNATSDLGVKAAHYILQSKDPLKTLVKLSQDFPTAAHLIAEKPSQSEFFKAVQQLQMAVPNPRTHPRAPPQTAQGVWINGLAVDLTALNPFGLLRLLRTEQRVIQSMHSLGFSTQDAIQLLTSSQSKDDGPSAMGEMYDVRSDAIVWFNNLEKDKRYSRLASDLGELLKPNYMMGNPLKPIRRNVFNAIFALDLGKPSNLQYFDILLMLVQREVPLHLGLMPIFSSPQSIVVGKLVKHFASKYGLRDAKDFIESIKMTVDSGVDIQDGARMAFENLVSTRKPRPDAEPSKDLEEVLSSMDDYVKEAQEWNERLGSDKAGLFLNGRLIELGDMWQQQLMQVYMAQLEFVAKKVQDGQLTKETAPNDWLQFWADTPGTLRRRNPHIKDDKNVWAISLDQARGIMYIADGPDPIQSMWVVGDFEHIGEVARKSLEWQEDHLEVRLAWLQHPIKEVHADSVADGFSGHVPHLDEAFSVPKGTFAVVVNGRVCGPFPESYDFHNDDFDACVRLASAVGTGVTETMMLLEHSPDPDIVLVASSVVQKDPSAAELEDGVVSTDKRRGAHPGFTAPNNTSVHMHWNGKEHTVGGESSAIFDIYALLDPVSPQTQRTAAILLQLLNTLKDQASLVLTLNPPLVLSDVPIKRFYRYVTPRLSDSLEPKKQPHAHFGHLPLDVLLSCSDLDAPRAWLTMPIVSVHDLDNIKLDNLVVSGGVEAVFTLRDIMVEGHALDSDKRPPRGLQLELIAGQRVVHDTIVMANYGYFQLQAPTPGIYTLSVRKGRSRTVANMTYVGEDAAGLFGNGKDNLLDEKQDAEALLISKSFEGLTVFVRVSKKPGMEKMDFLDDGATKKEARRGLWDNIKDKVGLGKPKQADINIFSVASGHLYERFMSIMFLSVLRHTKHTVKFWLIENFMSPSFKQFLPKLSKEYGFEYELVTYKWPHWLRAQTEKQRTIWAYKILFLDVLFPLQLDRVIFVDADQIVRTDMKELADMDIKKAAYAYTPFCDSRQETEGYRFWKQGYWLSHLRGRAYHISALYLVDLVRFRGIAAGDKLRAQYQGLSADPESLANLDQDLPNSMLDEVPMFSLPQEWLWCETWCSDESLTTAKTIDLCNNPMTKEPKLDRARRQIPEWTEYDNEVAEFAEKVKNEQPLDKDEL